MQFTFAEFFRELHGFDPFPWQARLAAQVLKEGWPTPIAVPTAGGKTATLDIALYAQAEGYPQAARRIFFIVDRRVIVDEAAHRARRIAGILKEREAEKSAVGEVARALKKLGGNCDMPVRTVTLRGGMLRDTSWVSSPLQPTIICSTVDQAGSAMLFRSYSSYSPNSWPIQAAMVAQDSLFLLDEAHLSRPFVETSAQVSKMRGKQRMNWTIVELSATPGAPPAFSSDEEDQAHPVLGCRLKASKLSQLAESKGDEFETDCAKHAERFLSEGFRKIGIIVNRVNSARTIFDRLSTQEFAETVLLTGRARPIDRDQLTDKILSRLKNPNEQDAKPLIVVATQCLEAGADISFDALITEAAPLDSLRQRFGRLNRYGETTSAPAVIILRKQKEDPIYGETTKSTWDWLQATAKPIPPAAGEKQAKGKKTAPAIDFGVNALEAALANVDVEKLCAPKLQAPILLPAYLDHLCQTSPEPIPEIDISLFLHGPKRGNPDVSLIWRSDLTIDNSGKWAELVAMLPPTSPETMAISLFNARAWLENQTQPTPDADIEVLSPIENKERRPKDKTMRPVLSWRGPDDSERLTEGNQIRPGMTLVIPCGYGGCDQFGWNPDFQEAVTDVAEASYEKARGRWAIRPKSKLEMDRQSVREYLESNAPNRAAEKFTMIAYPEQVREDDARVGVILGPRPARFQTTEVPEGSEQSGDSASFSATVSLHDHQQHVASQAAKYLDQLPQMEPFRETLLAAARWHDWGKADPRFQLLLYGGDSIQAAGSALLAKSGGDPSDWAKWRRVKKLAGYPNGARHELLSTSIVENLEMAEGIDRDLLLHLVASHHGRCRPFAPYVDDANPPVISIVIDGQKVERSAGHNLHEISSGVTERFWKLTRLYGAHGLAYLEALLRLADQQASREEQEQ